MSDAHRLSLKERNKRKIQVGMIITRLQKCVNGDIEMTPTQVSAAKILLAKTLPDKRAVEVQDITDYNSDPDSISSRQLAHIASAGSENATKTKRGKGLTH